MLGERNVTRAYYIELSFAVDDDGVPSDLEPMIDPLLTAFDDVVDVTDVDLGADLAKAQMDVCMHVDAESEVAAYEVAMTAARTAIHAAGHSTPGWEKAFNNMIESGQYKSVIKPAAGQTTAV